MKICKLFLNWSLQFLATENFKNIIHKKFILGNHIQISEQSKGLYGIRIFKIPFFI